MESERQFLKRIQNANSVCFFREFNQRLKNKCKKPKWFLRLSSYVVECIEDVLNYLCDEDKHER
jgi:hypothetical protein